MSGMRLCVRRGYLSRYIAWGGEKGCIKKGTLLHTYSVWLCALGGRFDSRYAALSGQFNFTGRKGLESCLKAS
jgi:hypothetical protein